MSLWLLLFVAASAKAAADEPVTCGSVVKLVNRAFDVRLHSADVKYGMGSGQQSVTGVRSQIEVGSNWQIKGNTTSHCRRGVPIACGATIRLENVEWHRNLHSHVTYEAPISTHELEVSIFGEAGLGDTGDDWQLICTTRQWPQERDVMFRHVLSGRYLSATGLEYSDPISGHVEIVASRTTSPKTKWKTAEGIFIQTAENDYEVTRATPSEHDEL